MTAASEKASVELRKPPLLRVFASFLRLGLTAFGGPAMVVHIRKLVTERGWVADEDFHNGVALCQSIPGATAMQTAAYAGLRAAGLGGAAAAYIGFGLPAFVLMTAFAALYDAAQTMPVAVSALAGLRVIVIAILADALHRFGRASIKGWRDAFLAAATGGFLGAGGAPPMAIAGAALLALALYDSGGGALPTGEKVPSDRPGSGSVRLAVAFAAAVIAAFLLLSFLDAKLSLLGLLMMKIDGLAFGGGYASVPLMFHEAVQTRPWLDAKTFADGMALGQVTPGPIVITATFIGYRVDGLLGAVIATLGIFTPSFLILVGIVPCFDRLSASPAFRRMLRGILASFVGLLLAVTVSLTANLAWTIPSILIGCLSFLALFLGVDILWVVLAGVVVSILAF